MKLQHYEDNWLRSSFILYRASDLVKDFRKETRKKKEEKKERNGKPEKEALIIIFSFTDLNVQITNKINNCVKL